MKQSDIIPLVVVGALLGVGFFLLKQRGDEADRVLRDLPRASYEACLETNNLVRRLDLDEELRDCDAEYLK